MASHTSSIQVFSDGGIVPITVFQPGRDDLWQLNHSMQPRYLNGEPVPGLPATWTTRVADKYKVSTRLQTTLIDAHCLLHPEMTRGDVEQKLSRLFGDHVAWSNGTGWESGNFRIQGLTSEGATVRATLPGPYMKIVRGGGEDWAEVFAIDPLNPPAIQSLADIDMTIWFFPTTALYTGGNLFPHFGGRCIVPFLGSGGLQYVKWPGFGVTKVGRVMQPALPARWDATAGLIDQ